MLRVALCVLYSIHTHHNISQVGQLAFPKDESSGGFPGERMYSDHTAQVMDEEAKNMVDEAYLRTIELMTKYRCACDHEALNKHRAIILLLEV